MSRSDRIAIAAAGGALVLGLAAAWLFFAPPEAAPVGLVDASAVSFVPSASEPAASTSEGTTTIVVDVEGAVAAPGVRTLPVGSRIADAIAAAGGYASDADLGAAAASINLAQPLTDGEQVRVPRVGDAVTAGGSTESGGASGGGGGAGSGGAALVDLNSATPDQLEALPGIGPVTVQKIVAARQEQPFASLEDAVQRGVIHRGQLEDIQGLATAG
ncbi:MAG: ComEA family DNA-binding protein [Candidatus Limnocylindria bacterium]